jgi:hypothetical protein
MRTMKLLPAVLLLAGCTTPQEHAAQLQAEMDHLVMVYGPACSKLGYAPNSDPWRNCVLQLSTKEDIQRYGYYPAYSAGYPSGRWHGGFWGPYW